MDTRMTRLLISFCLGCFLILGFSTCSSTEDVLKRYKGEYVCVGTAGGFSGASQGYRFDTQGRVVSFIGKLDKRKEHPQFTMDKSTTASFFAQLDKMKFADLSYNGGGSMNYFVELYSDTLKHRIHWAPGDTLAPLEVRHYYESMMNYFREHSPRRDSAEDAKG